MRMPTGTGSLGGQLKVSAASQDTIDPMSYDAADPWADETPKQSGVANNENRNTGLDASMSATLNIFGDSTASSMMDSMIGEPDPLGYSTNNNWGDYNSFNILSHSSNHSKSVHKTPNTSSTLGALANLSIDDSSKNSNGAGSSSKFGHYSSRPDVIHAEAAEVLSGRDSGVNGAANEVIDDYEPEENEESLAWPVDVKVWSDDEIKKFNPLTLKNATDGLIVRVREIPEKEGLVFKHTNYLISHTLKFSSEYLVSSDKTKSSRDSRAKGQNEDGTKVIRRYSDFAWLVEVLWKKYPFRLIPELPPKKFASSSNDVLFLQKRRRGLQRFLYQLCKHPILSKENLVIMFLTVPNDFSNWKKFANIELNDEFDGIRINLPRRFKIDLSDVLKGLRDNESDFEDNEDITDESEENHTSSNRNEFVINNINQIWNESPVNFLDKDFITNLNSLYESLSRLAEFWSKLYSLVERIEKRELALSADHQRFAIFLENMIKTDADVFSMDNLIENKSKRIDDETQNMTIINSILSQVCKYFVGSRKLKEEEMLVINNEILESWKSFQDYLIGLHFLIERFFNYKTDSEKEIQNLLQRIIKTNEKIKQLKMKSDIRGSEIDKHINVLITSMDQLSMLISRIILVKTTFVNEFKLFQKVKYLISEVFQNWFDERSKFQETKNDNIQRLLNDLKDLPLGN